MDEKDIKPVDDSEGAKALAEAQKPDPQHDYDEAPGLPPHAPNFEKPPAVEDLPADEVTDFSESVAGVPPATPYDPKDLPQGE